MSHEVHDIGSLIARLKLNSCACPKAVYNRPINFQKGEVMITMSLNKVVRSFATAVFHASLSAALCGDNGVTS